MHVHFPVGLLNIVGQRRVAVRIALYGAGAGRQAVGPLLHKVERVQVLPQPGQDHAKMRVVERESDELVTAEACQHVGIAQGLAQHGGAPDQPVADLMAELVVHQLQAVSERWHASRLRLRRAGPVRGHAPRPCRPSVRTGSIPGQHRHGMLAWYAHRHRARSRHCAVAGAALQSRQRQAIPIVAAVDLARPGSTIEGDGLVYLAAHQKQGIVNLGQVGHRATGQR